MLTGIGPSTISGLRKSYWFQFELHCITNSMEYIVQQAARILRYIDFDKCDIASLYPVSTTGLIPGATIVQAVLSASVIGPVGDLTLCVCKKFSTKIRSIYLAASGLLKDRLSQIKSPGVSVTMRDAVTRGAISNCYSVTSRPRSIYIIWVSKKGQAVSAPF